MKGPTPRSVDERFWEKVDKNGGGGCWLWTAYVSPLGYGLFRMFSGGSAATRRAHRVAYELTVGPVPDGLTLDHLCRNRRCVNPTHLEAVSQRENVLRSPTAPPAVNARKTECVNGHPFDEANTYVTPAGYRQCRACNRSNVAKGKPK